MCACVLIYVHVCACVCAHQIKMHNWSAAHLTNMQQRCGRQQCRCGCCDVGALPHNMCGLPQHDGLVATDPRGMLAAAHNERQEGLSLQ